MSATEGCVSIAVATAPREIALRPTGARGAVAPVAEAVPPLPRPWPGLYTPAAARPAGVGPVAPPAAGRLGRGGPLAPGEGHFSGPPDDLGGRRPWAGHSRAESPRGGPRSSGAHHMVRAEVATNIAGRRHH
jgi:hypothetical protein